MNAVYHLILGTGPMEQWVAHLDILNGCTW